MKCLETPWMQGMIRMCGDGFRQGWHERNGGNLSYRIPQTELEVIRDQLSFDQPWAADHSEGAGVGRRVLRRDGKRQIYAQHRAESGRQSGDH